MQPQLGCSVQYTNTLIQYTNTIPYLHALLHSLVSCIAQAGGGWGGRGGLLVAAGHTASEFLKYLNLLNLCDVKERGWGCVKC